MIGNDIIDLNFAGVNSRWQEQRFLDKLFSKNEQSFILTDDNRYQNIWRLWSMKESAYKIQSRNLKGSIFNPKFFKCDINSKKFGSVTFDDHTIITTTDSCSKIIYTTAHLENTVKTTEYFELNAPSQADKSQQLKKKAIQFFAQLKFIPEYDITIEKDDFGIPKFFIHGKAQDEYLTLTHHGDYGGFAISY